MFFSHFEKKWKKKSPFTFLVLVTLLGAVQYYYDIDIKVCLAKNECSKNNRAEDGGTAL